MQATQPILILPRPDGAGALVFGLSWYALVGSQVTAMARARARQLGASHYVAGGMRASAGGCVRIERRQRRRALHAAAQAYAHLYADGAYACVAPLPDGRYWLVAAQDGAVITRGDRIYDNAEQAVQALDALQSLRPELRTHDGSPVLARLAGALDAHSRLQPVGAAWPLRASVLGCGAAIAGALAWQHKQAAPPAASDPEQARAAWQAAADTWRRGIRIHPPEELRQVVQSLYAMPLAVQGWTLELARCTSEAGAWRCAAEFRRDLPTATYLHLARAVPPGWHAEFTGLDRSVLHWRIPGRGLTLAAAPGPAQAGAAQAHFPSALQRVAQAFTDLRLGPAEPLTMPTPRGSDGQPLAPPPGQSPASLQARRITLEGPLRSLAVLALHETLATWTSLQLRLSPGRPAALSGSVLQLQLEGTLYEPH
ncbi:hypothetical protein [Bordetella sp. 2513F-2]